MLGDNHGRNRPVNVALPPFLLSFIRKLGWATGLEDPARRATDGATIRPGSYGEGCGDSANEVGIRLLWDSILSKYDDQKSSVEKGKACWDRFNEAEEMCFDANERIRNITSWPDLTHQLGYASVFMAARSKIAWLLGTYSEHEHADRCSFSSGASTRLPRRFGQPPYKYSGIPESTFDNVSFGQTLIAGLYRGENFTISPKTSLWKQSSGGEVRLVLGNNVTSVAKNYKTDRAIAIEPDLNMYVQKGLGKLLRAKLKRVGVDLDNQENNQRAAYIGSVDESLATIDLSMASDTVSYELVKGLLPVDWFDALLACRSEVGSSTLGGVACTVLYQKFSSMGNGATFELESLIFWALCAAAAEAHGSDWRSVLVYGDDLILPHRSAQYCCDVLQHMGFKVNSDKSHFHGPYRESCGKHYLSGSDVTPFFVKKEDATLSGLFKLHNQLYRWISRTSHTREGYERLMVVLKWLRSKAPSDWQRPRIPDGIGDGAFVGTFDSVCPETVRPNLYGWEGFRVRVLMEVLPRPRRETLDENGKKLPKGVKGPIIVSTSLRLSYEGFLRSVLSPKTDDIYLPHLKEASAPWSELSQVPSYQVKTLLVPHFP